METFILKIDNEPDIKFTGERVASATSADARREAKDAGRWTELDLYKTEGGQFVCHQTGRTQWEGQHDRFSGKVCRTAEEVKEFFGHGWLAKRLYDNGGIDDVVEVE